MAEVPLDWRSLKMLGNLVDTLGVHLGQREMEAITHDLALVPRSSLLL